MLIDSLYSGIAVAQLQYLLLQANTQRSEIITSFYILLNSHLINSYLNVVIIIPNNNSGHSLQDENNLCTQKVHSLK